MREEPIEVQLARQEEHLLFLKERVTVLNQGIVAIQAKVSRLPCSDHDVEIQVIKAERKNDYRWAHWLGGLIGGGIMSLIVAILMKALPLLKVLLPVN